MCVCVCVRADVVLDCVYKCVSRSPLSRRLPSPADVTVTTGTLVGLSHSWPSLLLLLPTAEEQAGANNAGVGAMKQSMAVAAAAAAAAAEPLLPALDVESVESPRPKKCNFSGSDDENRREMEKLP